jgi:hypothetical protein
LSSVNATFFFKESFKKNINFRLGQVFFSREAFLVNVFLKVLKSKNKFLVKVFAEQKSL